MPVALAAPGLLPGGLRMGHPAVGFQYRLKQDGEAGLPHRPSIRAPPPGGAPLLAETAPTFARASRRRPLRPSGLWQSSGASVDIHSVLLFLSMRSKSPSHPLRAAAARPTRTASSGLSGSHGQLPCVASAAFPAQQPTPKPHHVEPLLTWDELFGLR